MKLFLHRGDPVVKTRSSRGVDQGIQSLLSMHVSLVIGVQYDSDATKEAKQMKITSSEAISSEEFPLPFGQMLLKDSDQGLSIFDPLCKVLFWNDLFSAVVNVPLRVEVLDSV